MLKLYWLHDTFHLFRMAEVIFFASIYWCTSNGIHPKFAFSKPLQQIHRLVMSLSYTGIEIKTAHSLESWNGGILVMVSGSVHVKGYSATKKFVETFFLAPQEKGYFVLNDIFHYVDEELVLQHPIAYLPQINLDSKIHSSTIVREQGLMIQLCYFL